MFFNKLAAFYVQQLENVYIASFKHMYRGAAVGSTVPFNIDVTHLFSSDACFIQGDISCVPNNGP